MIALIDGDILVYECAFAAEYTIYEPQDFTNQDTQRVHMTSESDFPLKHAYRYAKDVPKIPDAGNLLGKPTAVPTRKIKVVEAADKALKALDAVMRSIIQKTGATEIIVYLSEGKNFRHDLMAHLPEEKQYKANRRNTVKPAYFQLMRDTLIGKYGALLIKGFEADDALGIMHTNLNTREIDSVICTIDKDLQTVAGYHYNPTKKAFLDVDDIQAKYNFCFQVLKGDSTDNIPGLPKVGDVTARKALGIAQDNHDKWPTIVKGMYEKRIGKGWMKELKMNMALVRILKEPQKTLTIEDLEKPVLVAGLEITSNPAGAYSE